MLNKVILTTVLYVLMVFHVMASSDSSSISVDVGSDELGNKNSAVSVSLSGNNSKKYLFGMGKSEVPTGNETINSNFVYFGISKKISEKWKMTGMIESSGLKDAFTMITTSVPVRYSQNNFYVELVPALRNIRLTTTGNKKINVVSSAFGLKSGVFLGDHFRLSGSAYSYTYSADVSKLATFASSRFFNENTLLLSSGLLNKSYNVETGLDFDSFSVSLGKNKSISAIDDSSSESIYTVFDYYLSKAWALSFLFGEYLNTPEDQNNYSSVAVSYSF